MKRIASILKDTIAFVGLTAIVSIGLFASTKASAQDLFQIEQSFEHEFKVRQLDINSGWDVHLIQTPEGTPTQLVLTTSCAEFFEDGAEPSMMNVQKLKREKYGGYELKANQWMPRTTKVDIYTSQPLGLINVHKGARLTIQRFESDSTHLDIYVDSGAVLIADTLGNPGTTVFYVHDATLDLRHLRGRTLYIWTYGNSHVTEGDVQTSIPRTKEQCKERKLRMMYYNIGIGLSTPLWIEDNRYGSPYNNNRAFHLHNTFRTNDMTINRLLSWHFGLDVSATWEQLDNVVKVQDDQLVLDPSFGATPPRQYLYWWSIGLPVTLYCNIGKATNGAAFGLYVTLTPTFNFKPRLVTKSLDADDHWNTDTEKVDILNRFNVRAAIGLSFPGLGLGRLEFFTDLLPTYRSSAGAPQTRMFGLNFIF